jgi:hypothetical protein
MNNKERASNERVYVVKYRMPNEMGRNLRRLTVNAINQTDAIKAAKATVPDAKIIGGPQELDEGLVDFAKRVGKFISRCIGHGCFAYARSPMNAKKGSIGKIRKTLTRELASHAGQKMMDLGGADGDYPRVKIRNKKPKKRKPGKIRKRR